MSPSQIIGNICAAIATLIFLLRLQHLLSDYARREASNDQWVTPALFILIPVWLLLMGALLCVTANGGFDWLRLGRPALYAFTVAATVALAVVSFVFIALYIRPGFTPRGLYSPVIYLVHFATVLLVLLSLNQKFAPGIPTHWLRLPWTIFAALSLVACVGFFGYWIVRTGVGGMKSIAHRIGTPRPSSGEILTHISTLDPEKNFDDLLRGANRLQSREVREAATARLRSNPKFLEMLAAELEAGHLEPAVEFLYSATLTPTEQTRLARPARKAMQRWVGGVPAPNYTTKDNLKRLRRWGADVFPVLVQKFAGTGVEFTEVIADFEKRVSPTK
ncbi:MAG: hypothetical protein Q8N18_18720 [Opitutaceae bacterium]|nr:hypothetical protein [Opitutaceae bacterium]